MNARYNNEEDHSHLELGLNPRADVRELYRRDMHKASKAKTTVGLPAKAESRKATKWEWR